MKKFQFVHFRPFAAAALSQIAAIAFAAFTPTLGVLSRIIPIFAIAVAFSVYILICDKEDRVIVLITAIVSVVLAFTSGTATVKRAERVYDKAIDDGDYKVSGVIDYVSYGDGEFYYILTDCKCDGINTGNIALYGVAEEFYACDAVEFDASVEKAESVKNGKYSYSLSSGVSNVARARGDVTKIGVKTTVKYKFRKFISDKCSFMSDTSRKIALGLICGDTVAMKDGAEIYRAAGVAHVFAVSGMHVGLLCALLGLLLMPIPLRKATKSFIIICLIVTYSMACGFSASSLRAAIICSVYLVTDSAYENRDRLSAISVASMVVLLNNPFEFFGAGYRLSFILCLSLIILAPSLSAAINTKSEKLNGSIGVLFAATAATVPLCVSYFGRYPVISVVSNLLIVPAVSFGYYLCVFGVLLSTVFPPSITLYLADRFLSGIDYLTNFLASAKTAVTVFPSWLLAIYYSLLFLSSDVVNLNVKVKRVTAVFSGVCLIFALAFS